MGLLNRLRGWLGLAGSGGGDDADGEADDDSPRLDPDNVTEMRTESDDDPVERLRELEESGDDE
jgi:hypothetical protein